MPLSLDRDANGSHQSFCAWVLETEPQNMRDLPRKQCRPSPKETVTEKFPKPFFLICP